MEGSSSHTTKTFMRTTSTMYRGSLMIGAGTILGLTIAGMLNLTGSPQRPLALEHPNGEIRKTEEFRPIVNYRNHTGSWVGDIWYPPENWTLFSVSEMRKLFSGENIFWHGDSTSRRGASTFYAMLNASDDKDISLKEVSHTDVMNVNTDKEKSWEPCQKWSESAWFRPSLCRHLPGGGDFLTSGHRKGDCYSQLNSFLRSEMNRESNFTKGVNVFVVAQGIWEGVGKVECKDEVQPDRDFVSILHETLTTMEEYVNTNPGIAVVWRTTGFSVDKLIANTTLIHIMNRVAMSRIEAYTRRQHTRGLASRLTYVNWSGAIEPRSFGDERIEGDTPEHYGFSGRFAAIQMITNRFADHKKEISKFRKMTPRQQFLS